MNVPADREILPQNVTPLKYDVTLDPNLTTFKFDGTVKIDLQVNEDTDFVELNNLDIEIQSASLNGITASDTATDEDKQTARFTFPEAVSKGSTVTLKIEFIGNLNENMAGFYRSMYEENGETKYMATSQMEPTDCRRAFPCFDEPALKAVFDITLISDENMTALSNMDVKEVKTLENGRKATSFNTTPLMSTYLVAFIVGDLRYVESKLFRVPVRVYTTPGLERDGQFSADLTAKTLDFFETTFGIKYPLPKIDNVAIADFSAGAMENWGLVTYRIVDLLLDEANTNIATKQRVAEVVQHELAHQWFGNLVTMDWWEGLWLNEGFATWMSWFSCNHFYPDWKVWESYVTDSLQQAMALDALRSSHPIEVPVQRADEINQIFDSISYAKGSSLLKMISKWLGEEVFIKGVSNYLNKHKYGNTQTSDLWDALSVASGKNVTEVMQTWTKKIGFPVITVKENKETSEITVTQNRYLTTGDVKPEEDGTIYPVFLGLKTANGTDESIVLNERSKTLKLESLDFYKFNADQVGIYRTSYSPERWISLGKAGSEGKLSVEDRAGLIADASALAQSGYQSTVTLLDLIKGWKAEESVVVWDETLTRIATIKNAWLFGDEVMIDRLDSFARSLVSEKAHQKGHVFSESDSFLEQSLKATLFGGAAAAKDPETVATALEMFRKYVAGDKSAIHPNIRGSVFAAVAKNDGTEESYDQILKIYQNPVTVDEKITALRTLGRFSDAKLMQRTFGYLFDGTVRSQDLYIPLQGMRGHRAGVEAMWQWVQDNWEEIVKRFPSGLSMLGSLVQIGSSGFTSEERIKEIENFYSQRSTKGFDKGLAQALDTIRAKSNWVQRDTENIDQWLKKNGF